VSNAGFTDTLQIRIASLAFSATDPRKAYLAAGAKGAGGGFFLSTDGGRSRSLRSAVPELSGNNTKGDRRTPRNSLRCLLESSPNTWCRRLQRDPGEAVGATSERLRAVALLWPSGCLTGLMRAE